MKNKEILKKAESDEGLTVKEILSYQKTHKPKTHVYGKYGTLAKQYLEENNPAKMWALAGDLPEYLHGIDSQADELYETLHAKLSIDERFKRTGEFLKDLQKETEIQQIIQEEILNELVYVK